MFFKFYSQSCVLELKLRLSVSRGEAYIVFCGGVRAHRRRSACAEASVSPGHGCHQAWVSHLSAANREALEQLIGWRNILCLLVSSFRCAPWASAGKLSMYVLVHISKLSRGAFSHPTLLFLSFATPQLAERWSMPGDKGVCSPISKHSPGAGREKSCWIFCPLCSGANSDVTGCQLVDMNR